MSIAYNTSMVRNGLVLQLDAANRKSYPGSGTAVTNLTSSRSSAVLSGEATNNLMYSSGTFVGVISNLVGACTVTTLETNSKYRVQCTTAGSLRILIPDGLLVNDLTYTLSYKYNVIAGLNPFLSTDFCDAPIVIRTAINTASYSLVSATGSRSTYDSTYRFFDIISLNVGDTFDIWDIQVEQKSYPTVFVNGVRSSAVSNVTITEDYTQIPTLINGVGYDANNNGMFSFDGTDDYVNLSTHLMLGQTTGWTTSYFGFPTIDSVNTSNTVFYTSVTPRTVSLVDYSITDSSVSAFDVDSSGNVYIVSNYVYLTNRLGGIFKLDSSFQLNTGYDSEDVRYLAAVTYDARLSRYDTSKLYYTEGATLYHPSGRRGLKRLNSDGSLDTSFGTNTVNGGFNNIVWEIAEDPASGKIYVCGVFTSYNGTSANRIIKLNVDGTIDTSFAIGSGFNNIVYGIHLDSNGKLYATGLFTSYNGTLVNRIVRLNGDGSIDAAFDVGSGFNNYGLTMAEDSNGKICIGGNFTTYKGVTANRMIRLNTDGSADTGFSVGTGFNNIVYDIEIDSNGKLYAIGSFTTFVGASANRIVRLNSNGTLDAAFNFGTGFNGVCLNAKIDSAGKLLVGGAFSTYNGTTVRGVVRLDTDGTLLRDIFSSENGFELAGKIGITSTQAFGTGNTIWLVMIDLVKSKLTNTTYITRSELFAIFNGNTAVSSVETLNTSGTYALYVNGNLIADVPNSDSTSVAIEDLMKGTATSSNFKGRIGQISVYDRGLTSAEVSQNFNALRGRYGI